MIRRLGSLVLVLMPLATSASPGPQPVPFAASIPAARDIPFAGNITLDVDARSTPSGVFHVEERIPIAAPGPIVLLYPQWIAGSHAASGPIANVAGLHIRAAGRELAWSRDLENPYAFHVERPAGTTQIELRFDYVSPVGGAGGQVAMTPNLLRLDWTSVALYPAGWFSRDIPVRASVTLSPHFRFGTALSAENTVDVVSGSKTTFASTSFETLFDSPLYAGTNVARIPLGDAGGAPVALDVIADESIDLDILPEQLGPYASLVTQARLLFGSRHFDHYDFLVATSGTSNVGGLEHLRSSEIDVAPDFLTAPENHLADLELIPHEYAHSWNGLFRKPADLWVPEPSVAMRDDLLWVYEGQTELWGNVLAARAGLRTQQQALDALAIDAASARAFVGNSWKSLQDSTNDPLYVQHRAIPYRDWQGREDYYKLGELLWLDVDMLLRERSHGRRSLDDFARSFFGIDAGSEITETYDFDDVVATLQSIVPYDWAAFLRSRLASRDPNVALGGLERGGYRLIFTATPTSTFVQTEGANGLDLTYSLGIDVGRDGTIRKVAWDGAAFRAGAALGNRIVSVNGRPFTDDALLAAVADSPASPVSLAVSDGANVRTMNSAIATERDIRISYSFHRHRIFSTRCCVHERLEIRRGDACVAALVAEERVEIGASPVAPGNGVSRCRSR